MPDDEQDQKISSAVAEIMASRPAVRAIRLGDRVRVTMAIAECGVEWLNNPHRGHAPEALGLCGTVVDYPSVWPIEARLHSAPQGHTIAVRFDSPVEWTHPIAGRRLGGGALFAPTELEHIGD